MKRLFSSIVLGCVTALAGAPALAQTAQAATASRIAQDVPNSSQQDQAFLRAATDGGLDEVTLGNLAEHKSGNPAIQAFGRRMVLDHTRINNEIAPIAERLGVTPPTKLADQDQIEYEKLRLMPVADFNTAYVRLMVHAHRGDLAAFDHESHVAGDPQLKQVVTSAAMVIAEHLRLAIHLANQLGIDFKGPAHTAA